MIAELNTKYSQAIVDTKRCLTLSESFELHKIPNDREVLSYLTKQLIDAIGLEYPGNYFKRENLLNSNYHDLGFHDFEKYYYLSELSGYQDSGRDMLKNLLSDSNKAIESPVLVKGKNNIYWQLTGNLQMMAYKVLGIFPVIREIPIDANIIP